MSPTGKKNALFEFGQAAARGFLGDLGQPQPSLLGGLLDQPPPNLLYANALSELFNQSLAPPTKRKVYFAFKFDDVMRVNNVRNAWKIDHPDSALFRSFYDSSVWAASQSKGDEALKKLMRENVQNTSAVCV